jgi:hypothetical protein
MRKSDAPAISVSPLNAATARKIGAPMPMIRPHVRRPERCGKNEKKSRPAKAPRMTITNSPEASSESTSRISSRKVGPHRKTPATAAEAPSHASAVTITLWR